MANTSKKPITTAESVIEIEGPDISEKNNEVERLKQELDSLKTLLASLNKPNPTIIDTTSKMDRPCTLIHLWECPKGLGTTIIVNDNNIMFTTFGEKRIFRFADMQNIISKYRSFFDRGIFTLGEDCNDFAPDFGIDIMKSPMSVSQFNHIEQLPIEEFSKLVYSLNTQQRIVLAKTWIQRYEDHREQYNNIEKVRILNKATNSFLKDFIQSIASQEE